MICLSKDANAISHSNRLFISSLPTVMNYVIGNHRLIGFLSSLKAKNRLFNLLITEWILHRLIICRVFQVVCFNEDGDYRESAQTYRKALLVYKYQGGGECLTVRFTVLKLMDKQNASLVISKLVSAVCL